MKYKKHIITSALAISLLVGGSSVFAATPQDLGIKNVQGTYQKQNNKDKTKSKIQLKKQGSTVGVVSALTSSGFTIDVKNPRTKLTSSVDVKTDATTVYSKDGISALVSDLAVGQKVIIKGTLDKTTNILTAKTVATVSVALLGNVNSMYLPACLKVTLKLGVPNNDACNTLLSIGTRMIASVGQFRMWK